MHSMTVSNVVAGFKGRIYQVNRDVFAHLSGSPLLKECRLAFMLLYSPIVR